MSIDITFIRHGETVANEAAIWQGQGDSPLSARGRRQVRRLGARLASRPFDLVLASDLGRAAATASAAFATYETDKAWREADTGTWEGMTSEQVRQLFPEEYQALVEGKEVRIGGGETYDELAGRIDEAVRALVDRVDEGARVAVVSHGGAIGAVVGGVLGLRRRTRPWPIDRLANTSLTTVRFAADGSAQLAVFNDAAHLDGDLSPAAASGRRVVLIRHGETDANASGRWQGRTDGLLSPAGRRQADRLAGWHPGIDRVYTSPLRRARDTAHALVTRDGVDLVERPDLMEIHFGEWEDRTPEDIESGWPDSYRSIYVDGTDLPRGGHGECWEDAASRIDRVVAEICDGDEPTLVGVVTHGGASRAYVARLLGIPFAERSRLGPIANTAMSHLAVTSRGPVLTDYNLTPHLES